MHTAASSFPYSMLHLPPALPWTAAATHSFARQSSDSELAHFWMIWLSIENRAALHPLPALDLLSQVRARFGIPRIDYRLSADAEEASLKVA